MRRRSGMTLVLVLMVMLVGGFLVYAAFDIAGNAHNSSMNMVTQQKLYNYAQSGLEFGKARLLEYYESDDLEKGIMGMPSDWADLRAEDNSGADIPTNDFSQPGEGINVSVDILSCNYHVPGSYIDRLPPIWNGGEGSGVGSSSLTGVGSSGFIDPNRNLLGNGADGSSAFVIRSTAIFAEGEANERHTEVETMVVISNE